MKRRLFLWHRYLGIGLSLLFALWFVSGVAMLYVRFPILDPEDRFPMLPRFDPAAFVVTPAEAITRAGVEGYPRRVRLAVLLDRPIYYILPVDRPWIGVYADDGIVLGSVDTDLAREVVRRYVDGGSPPRYLGFVDAIDQWTLTNSLNLHRPLYRFALDDEDGTEMYVSEKTGEVVMVTTRRERRLAWIGPIVHWMAPEVLRTKVAAWRQTVLWLSVAGTTLATTGLMIGALRYRRRGYVLKGTADPHPAKSPYIGVKLQHHWAGLFFGAVTLTWIVSGLLYLNPGGRYQGDLSTETQVTPYSVGGVRGSMAPRAGQADPMRGGPLDPALWTESPGAAWARVLRPVHRIARVSTDGGRAVPFPKVVELHRFAGRPYYVFYSDVFESVVVAADDPVEPAFERHSTGALVAQAQRAVTGELRRARLLDRYDAYYYSAGYVAAKRLPVLRLDFDDPVTSLMYVDPHTGTIFRSYDTQAKVMRWLVVGLHCLDFPFLILNRPAWDLVIIGFSAGGLLLSTTGLVMGWRRVEPRRRRRYMHGLLVVGVLVIAAPALAQGSSGAAGVQSTAQGPSTAPDTSQPPRHLETVVVTASAREERVGDLPVTIQAFEAAEIRQSTATTVTDFLAERGVAFFSVWTPGQTSINIRGGATDGQGRDFRSQVVVLINGRRAGTANISKLALHDVHRIEILRGPGSLVYGSQALGGVVNLITRDGLRDRGAYLRLNTGSWGLVDAAAQYGATRGRWDYFVSAHGGRRGDYDAGADAIERPQRNTAYQQGGGMVVLGYTYDAFQRLTFTARSDGMYDTGFRGSSWDWDNLEDRTNLSTDLAYTGRTASNRASWDVQTSFFRDVDDLRWGAEVVRLASGLPGPGVDRDDNIRRQTGVIVRGSTTLQTMPANALQIGADSEWTRLRSNRVRTPLPGRTTTQIAPFDNNSNSRNVGIFVEDVHRLFAERLVLRGGARFDVGQHDIRATPNVPLLRERAEGYDAFTYRLGATIKPAPAAALRFGVGTGYRAPTASELAVDFTTVLGNQIVGNPDLKPEQTTSIEVGAAIERERVWVDLALFRNDITDRIATVPETPGSSRMLFVNRDESDVVGLELQSRVDMARLGTTTVWVGANGVYHFRMQDLDAVRRNLNSDRINRMYQSQGSALLGVTGARWNGRVAGTYYGPVWYETEENLLIPFGEPFRTFIHRKSPFWVWNLQGKRALGAGLWVTAAVQNLLDKNEHPLFIAINRAPIVADVSLSNGGVGNSMPGRAFVIGFEYRP